MWRRFSWLLPALTAAACTGLFLDKGNAYPCDFAEGPGLRDAACQPGDVCRSNNLCGKYIYEGPRFEGAATVPLYGPGSGEGEVLHPLVLKEPARLVSADVPFSRAEAAYLQDTTGTIYALPNARLLSASPRIPTLFPPGFMTPTKVQTFYDDPTVGGRPNVLLSDDSGHLAIGRFDATRADPVRDGGLGLVQGDFRVIEDVPPSAGMVAMGKLRTAVPVVWRADDIGELINKPGPGAGWTYEPWVSPTAINPQAFPVFDVAGITQPRRLWVLALDATGLTLYDRNDGGVTQAAFLDTLTTSEGELHTDPGSRIVAAVRRGSLGRLDIDVLSTFRVNIDATGPVLSSPWPDCVPCPNQRVTVISPTVRSGAPTVEVVCTGIPLLPRALRITGSVALSQTDACITQVLDLPLPFSRVATVGVPPQVVQWNAQTGLVVGGRNGELWTGETLSTLLPDFLDRVPRDVAPANTGVTPSLAVITDTYLALQQTTENFVLPERLNGFRRVPQRELGVTAESRLAGFVHGVGGWAIDVDGKVVQVRIVNKVGNVRTGVQLVTASGDAIRDSIGGEAFTRPDGGPLGFFLAADDSVYFLQDPEGDLPDGGSLQELAELPPDLTPEPSVPIRSFALERTPLGTFVGTEPTDPPSRARGYLVTSRNVSSWELAGTPARWSSTPLVLAGGQPEEVWFDSPRSALGRVGYSNGEIYSLPGGYELAEALPADDHGVPPQVLDYENLGGWPVAYATTGLFVAGWDQVNGKLQNRFADGGINRPMTWREVTLPDGGRPWMRTDRKKDALPGKLYVAQDPALDAADGGAEQTYRLLLFLDEQVVQVARHVRHLNKK